MPIVALLSGVLVGFVGLVIDIGGVTSDHELAQSAADGAALTAAYDIGQPGATEANATLHARAVLTQDGVPTAAATITYLDSAGNPTAVEASVATVQAVVAFNHANRFLPILGVAISGISATARAAGTPCGLCLMQATGNALSLGGTSQVTVSGAGTVVNSTSNPNVTMNAGSVLTATANRLAASHVTGTGTISPAVTVGAAVADQLASLATPAFSGGNGISFSSPNSGSGTINPGDYRNLTINGSYALTLNPGVYTFNQALLMNGGSMSGTGVTLYFPCRGGNKPVDCAAGGQAGGRLTIDGGVINVTAPNTTTVTLNGGSGGLVTVGTIYTEAMPWALTHVGDTYTLNSELVVSSLRTAASTTLNLDYTAAQNAPNPVGSTADSTPSLSL
jgi:hypothetical protein